MICLKKISPACLFYFLTILCVNSTAFSQQSEIKFEHISIEQGLSQSTVTDIVQDKIGYMWFSTENGLNRYDGYNFKIYTTEPGNSNSISSNFINVLYVDRNNFLWIGTNYGLNKYDPSSNVFTRFQYDRYSQNGISGNSITSVTEDNEGNIWAGTEENGLNKYDLKEDKFTVFENIPRISTLLNDKDGNIWIGAGEDLYIYTISDKNVKKFNDIYKSNINLSNITSLYKDKNNSIWIGAWQSIYKFDILTKTLLKIKKPFVEGLSNTIYSFADDNRDNIWAGTAIGIYKINPDGTGEFVPNDPRETPGSINYINSLYKDISGVMWGGARGSGIIKYNPYVKKIRIYKSIPGQRNSLSGRIVRSVYLDRAGILWVGTQWAGLNRIDRKNGKYKNFGLDKKVPGSIWCIHGDKKGSFWLASRYYGLIKFNTKSGKCKSYLNDPNNSNSIAGNMLETIFEDSEGFLWIGTAFNGLDKFDPVTEEFTHINKNDSQFNLSNNSVYAINEDNNKILWVGTRDGLNKIDLINRKNKIYKNDPNDPQSLSFNFISVIFKDRSGIIWVGTYGGGINKYDRKTDKFERFGREQRLANSIIYSILEDDDGNLWVSTNKGISKFFRDTEYFKNFDIKYGLQGYEYNLGASYRSPDGEMFFGGMNGLNSFYPSEIKINSNPPEITFTRLEISGKEYEDLFVLNETGLLELDHTQNRLSFEFSALDYVDPNSNNYRYKMEGFEDEWTKSGNRRYVNYTLPAGDYKFTVIGSNSDNVWNEEGASLRVTILPPWWKTNWFRLLFAVILISGLFCGYRLRAKTIEK